MKYRVFLIGAAMAFIANAIVRMALFWFTGSILGMESLVPIIGVCLFLPSILFTPFVGWLIDNFQSRLIPLAVQFTSAIAFIIVTQIETFGLPTEILVFLSLIFSLSASYNKSYIFSLAKHNYKDVEPIILKLNIISTSMMVVSPALVGIPLLFDEIPFLSLFYLSAFCLLIFMAVISMSGTGKKSRMPFKQYFSYTYKQVSESSALKNNFAIFLLCNFSFGSIAVSLPLLISSHYGSELGGEIYSQVEIVGGILSILASRYFKVFDRFNTAITAISISAMIMLAICSVYFSYYILMIMTFAVFPYSVIQIVNTQVAFFKNTPKEMSAGLRGVLTMGQATAASLSCAVVYLLIALDMNWLNLLISSCCVGIGFAIRAKST